MSYKINNPTEKVRGGQGMETDYTVNKENMCAWNSISLCFDSQMMI